MARNSSKVWTPLLERDGEEKPRGLFLILLIWEEGGALVKRFYSCLFGCRGRSGLLRETCQNPVSASAPTRDGAPGPGGRRAGFVLGGGSFLGSWFRRVRGGGEITLLLPRGRGNVHWDGPSEKHTVFRKRNLGER